MSETASLPDRAPPLEARDLLKSFVGGDGSELEVLRGVSVRVESGEAVAVIGASGAGKSTLLHILGALDGPSGGEVLVGGRPVAGLEDEELARIRNHHIGFVFQFHHLLREFTALENVMMPALLAGTEMDAARAAARELLDAVGVSGREEHKPRQLSGGEQQRVAVARGFVRQQDQRSTARPPVPAEEGAQPVDGDRDAQSRSGGQGRPRSSPGGGTAPTGH